MANAVFLYTTATGIKDIMDKKAFIESRLLTIFKSVKCVCFKTMKEGCRLAKSYCGRTDALIIGGGDGTFHHIIAAIAEERFKPVIGYIGLGTMCDVGANFGAKRNIRKALEIIRAGHTKKIDLVKINDSYFVYMAASGRFANISYTTRKDLGRFSYYLKAMGQALAKKKYQVSLQHDGRSMTFETPFVLILNGSHVGGFKVNQGKINDGLFDIYMAPCGFLNGLWTYFFNKKNLIHIQARTAHISLQNPQEWCLDGEPCAPTSVDLVAVPEALEVYCDKKLI